MNRLLLFSRITSMTSMVLNDIDFTFFFIGFEDMVLKVRYTDFVFPSENKAKSNAVKNVTIRNTLQDLNGLCDVLMNSNI